jgi:hypothetical protein
VALPSFTLFPPSRVVVVAGCYVTWCPCLAAGEVAHRTGGTYAVDCLLPMIAGGLLQAVSLGSCICPTHCFFWGPTRDRLRKKYNIEDVRVGARVGVGGWVCGSVGICLVPAACFICVWPGARCVCAVCRVEAS